jgi:hypothetical protein
LPGEPPHLFAICIPNHTAAGWTSNLNVLKEVRPEKRCLIRRVEKPSSLLFLLYFERQGLERNRYGCNNG